MGYALPRECSKETLLLGMRSLGAHLLWEGLSAAPLVPAQFQPLLLVRGRVGLENDVVGWQNT